jgi:hypothetical protein
VIGKSSSPVWVHAKAQRSKERQENGDFSDDFAPLRENITQITRSHRTEAILKAEE